MPRVPAVFRALDKEPGSKKLHVLPLEPYDFRAPQPVAIGQKHKRIITLSPAALSGRRKHSPALIRLEIPPLSFVTIYIVALKIGAHNSPLPLGKVNQKPAAPFERVEIVAHKMKGVFLSKQLHRLVDRFLADSLEALALQPLLQLRNIFAGNGAR